MPEIKPAYPTSPLDIMAQAQGFLAQTYDRQLVRTTAALVDQTAYYLGVPLRAGAVVTNVHVNIIAGGTIIDQCQVGLYNTAGSRVASTADLGTSWQAPGMKTHALSAPYTPPTTTMYYVAILASTNAGTLPTMGFQGNAAVFDPLGSNPTTLAMQLSQASLPPTATFAVTACASWWAAVS